MHHFFVKKQEKTMQTLRDIRFSKDKVNKLVRTKTITNTKMMTKLFSGLPVWIEPNSRLDKEKLEFGYRQTEDCRPPN